MRQITDLGNGDWCPVEPKHGRMFVLGSGNQFCAHDEHSARNEAGLFEGDGVTPYRATDWTESENREAFGK